MAGKLITLPLRVGFKSARLFTRLAGEAAGRAMSLAGQAVGASSPDRDGAADRADAIAEPPLEATAQPAPHAAETAAAPEPAPAREEPAPVSEEPADVVEEPAPVYEEPAPLREEPAHVSEEPELVREEAEPGAEDGAGAAVTVVEPWHGYARMSASEIIARTEDATPAELAAVRLYEAGHRSRETVLAAVDRQLKRGSSGSGA